MTGRIFVKNKRLKESSKRWLVRHLNDPYVALAKKDGYRSRAAYKLIEIDKRFNILKKDSLVVDLGAAPGGWAQVASKICSKNAVIAVDLLDIEPINNVSFIKGDFLDSSTTNSIRNELNGRKPDVIMSDMAPSTCGIKKVDSIRIMNLVSEVFEFSKEFLGESGSMIVKIFQGGAEQSLLKELRKSFGKVNHFKPASSRKESIEMYLVATKFRTEEPLSARNSK
jgi:23S rRNA (uridine2552-2'-O)-methyltransferase